MNLRYNLLVKRDSVNYSLGFDEMLRDKSHFWR